MTLTIILAMIGWWTVCFGIQLLLARPFPEGAEYETVRECVGWAFAFMLPYGMVALTVAGICSYLYKIIFL